ncbi:MAG: hypothetical protein J6V20_00345 [Bacteroidaceae bacterium]|nr:hypothetical protein [Bacteroidaceae bacterium]
MNIKLLLLTQIVSFFLMLGTAEHLFTGITSTIIFTLSFAMFIKSSIYINKNEKHLLRDCKMKEEKY